MTTSADLVLDLSAALLQCLCSAVTGAPNPPEHCCYRVGTEPVHDVDLHGVDLCCEGLAYVLLRDTYPSVESFPDNDIVRQAQQKCPPVALAVGLRVGIVRCVPDNSKCAPNNAAFIQNVHDMKSINTAACCFRDYFLNTMPFRGMSVVLERNQQGSTTGGCTERYLNLVVQVPNVDCTCG